MSIAISGRYLGNKRVSLVHEPSGAEIITSAPKDNNGDGLLFSPTDLCAASLGACIVTVMAIIADRSNIDINGTYFALEKHMTDNPRRIGKIVVIVHMPATLKEADRQKLERTATACPVHHSLREEMEIEVSFLYDA